MKYTKEEARVKKQALTSLQVRAIPPVVKTTGISPTMSMKLYLVEYTTGSTVKNMIVRAKNHIEAETQVKVSVIANIHDDNF